MPPKKLHTYYSERQAKPFGTGGIMKHIHKNWRKSMSMICAVATATVGMNFPTINANAVQERSTKENAQHNSLIMSDCHFPLATLDSIPNNTGKSGRNHFRCASSVDKSISKPSESYIPLLIIAVNFEDFKLDNDDNISERFFTGEKSVTSYYHDQSFGKFTFMPAKETSSSSNNDSGNLYDEENDGVVVVNMDMPHPDWSFDIGMSKCETDEELQEYSEELDKSTLTVLNQVLMQADEYVDFSMYDADNSGTIENTELALGFVIAGKSAAVVLDEDYEQIDNPNEYVWPHEWKLSTAADYYGMDAPKPDGVVVSDYVMQPEYNKDTYEGIGTLVHELGHYIGLPDLYDTTYTDGEWSGYCADFYSIMDYGNYCIDPETGEKTCSSFDIWSKIMLGWVEPEYANENGVYTINATDYDNLEAGCTALIIPTQHENEYYIVENRQSEKWDAAINYTFAQLDEGSGLESQYEKGGSAYKSGLILWHIDMTHYDEYWNKETGANIVNSSDHHPCVVPLYGERMNPDSDVSEAVYSTYGEYPAMGMAYYSKDKWEFYYDEPALDLPVYGNGEDVELRSARWDSGITVKFLDSDSPSMHIEVNFDNHIHYLEHHDAVPATENETGVAEYWICSLCKKYFTDENGENEVSYEDLILPATGSTVTTSVTQITETTETTTATEVQTSDSATESSATETSATTTETVATSKAVTSEESSTESTTETVSSSTTESAETTTTSTTESTSSTADKHIASDTDLCKWAVNDYSDKTKKKNISAEITSKSDDVYEITLKDKNGNTIDVYTIDPVTGTGKNSANEDVDLPQTGMSSAHRTLAGLSAVMTLTGIALVKKSRKKDEE